jgi:DNA-binding GntR family transcriptional regulator
MNMQVTVAPNDELTGGERAADLVTRTMLEQIVEGDLLAGELIHDHAWADALGVSRTPAREAIQRLKGMGLLNIAAARYTRLREFDIEQARREAREFALLHHSLLCSLVPNVPIGVLTALERAHDDFSEHTHPNTARVASFKFFQTLRAIAPNSAITLGATASAFRLRLAEPALPGNPFNNGGIHTAVIHALAGSDLDHAYETFLSWANQHCYAGAI